MRATGWVTIRERHAAPVSGKTVPHFGYPFCHQGDTLDPEYGKNRSCAEFAKPSALLGTHIAPLGMKFYNGKMFPPSTRAASSSPCTARDRTVKQGYNVDAREGDRQGRGKPSRSSPAS